MTFGDQREAKNTSFTMMGSHTLQEDKETGGDAPWGRAEEGGRKRKMTVVSATTRASALVSNKSVSDMNKWASQALHCEH